MVSIFRHDVTGKPRCGIRNMVEFYRGGAGARDKRNMALKVADIKGCVHFPYLDLKDATKNFDPRPVNKGGCKLGEGGFGPVFKGTLRYTDVAIKGISKRARVSFSV